MSSFAASTFRETGYQEGIHDTIKNIVLFFHAFYSLHFIKSVGSWVLRRADGSGGTFCRPLETADLLANAAEQWTGNTYH
jgi:hypothetical protein